MKAMRYIFPLILVSVAGCMLQTSQPVPAPSTTRYVHWGWEQIQATGHFRVQDLVKQGNRPKWFLKLDVEVHPPPVPSNAGQHAGWYPTLQENQTNGIVQVWLSSRLLPDIRKCEPPQGVHLSNLSEGKYRLQYLNPDGTTVEVQTLHMKH